MKSDIIIALIIVASLAWATYVTIDAVYEVKVIKPDHNEWPL